MAIPVIVGTMTSGPEIAGVAKREVTPTLTCARDRPVAGSSACRMPAAGSRLQSRPPSVRLICQIAIRFGAHRWPIARPARRHPNDATPTDKLPFPLPVDYPLLPRLTTRLMELASTTAPSR
jgi:hypothetical protein